jgi:hypothetical protein
VNVDTTARGVGETRGIDENARVDKGGEKETVGKAIQ